METFVLLAFATFITWEFILTLLPVTVHPRLQPLIVAGMAYGLYQVPTTYLIVIAAAGGVALLHRYLVPEPVEPIKIRLPRFRRGRRVKTPPGVGGRIPPL
jgi:hypothetical protein